MRGGVARLPSVFSHSSQVLIVGERQATVAAECTGVPRGRQRLARSWKECECAVAGGFVVCVRASNG